MSGILSFFVILFVLVVVHELGHFAVAKLAKVKVLEFGVGFPPRVLSVRRGDTLYSLNLVPLGGFVRMVGEEDPTDPASLARRSAAVRLAVLAAGSAMNALLPILLFTIVFTLPQDIQVTDVTIVEVADGSPAQQAGVQPGDIVRQVDGRRIDNSRDLGGAVQRRINADMVWVVERRGRTVQLRVMDARVAPPEGQGATGVTFANARVTVTSVAPGSTAESAGLLPGDLFVRVGDRQVLDEGDAVSAASVLLESAPDEPVPIEVLRDGEFVRLMLASESGQLAGFTVDVRPAERRSDPIWRAVPMSFRQIWDILVMFRNEISRLTAGSSSLDITGPIGIAQITGEVASAGLSPLIMWTALLSINLAIVNLLPIPALDGGRITLVLLELARGGRRLAPEKERIVHLVGFAILITAVIAVSINDIQRLIAGDRFLGG